MFKNLGGIIKKAAIVFFWLEVIASVIIGCVLLGETDGVSLLWMLVGLLLTCSSFCVLYGFGEIIDKLSDIEKNTRGEKGKSEVQTKIDRERANKIEKLRLQGLITEEEYRQAISTRTMKGGVVNEEKN